MKNDIMLSRLNINNRDIYNEIKMLILYYNHHGFMLMPKVNMILHYAREGLKRHSICKVYVSRNEYLEFYK